MEIRLSGTLDVTMIDNILKMIGSKKSVSIFDLSKIRFVKPFGLVLLLQIFDYLEQIDEIIFPDNHTISYMARAGFFDQAQEIINLDDHIKKINDNVKYSKDNKTLIAVTKIENKQDILATLVAVNNQTRNILINDLKYENKDIEDFVVLLSELLDNIRRHSGSNGYISAQSYRFQNSNYKYISVCISDTGIGMKQSYLENGYPNKLEDKGALELAIIKESSRFSLTGERGGNGYKGIKEKVSKLNGAFFVKTGNCRINAFNKSFTFEEGVPYFKGTQIEITLPQKTMT
ncbi:sensor histidine kinase [Bacillus sp. ISL-18]|uniref:ATP-binding protein n=1 Tax=Bacillus sp. ISL-18 TaxID=2819118 RepID=UPI001BE658BE|nr:ATP-binding protein [Bacillus sp. ISL-18]MBT2655357.1 sensor histidine kinase [Bacillus sp. ISL-18]